MGDRRRGDGAAAVVHQDRPEDPTPHPDDGADLPAGQVGERESRAWIVQDGARQSQARETAVSMTDGPA